MCKNSGRAAAAFDAEHGEVALEAGFGGRNRHLREESLQGKMHRMSTITAVLDADPDGTLHLPLPAELRSSRVKVTARLESVSAKPVQKGIKLKELLSRNRGLDGAVATARIAEVYEDREAWRAQ